MSTFDWYGVDISPFPAFCERYPNGLPLRPPIGQPIAQAAVAPAPVHCKPEPAPAVVPFNVFDPVDVARYVRECFSAGRTPRAKRVFGHHKEGHRLAGSSGS